MTATDPALRCDSGSKLGHPYLLSIITAPRPLRARPSAVFQYMNFLAAIRALTKMDCAISASIDTAVDRFSIY